MFYGCTLPVESYTSLKDMYILSFALQEMPKVFPFSSYYEHDWENLLDGFLKMREHKSSYIALGKT